MFDCSDGLATPPGLGIELVGLSARYRRVPLHGETSVDIGQSRSAACVETNREFGLCRHGDCRDNCRSSVELDLARRFPISSQRWAPGTFTIATGAVAVQGNG